MDDRIFHHCLAHKIEREHEHSRSYVQKELKKKRKRREEEGAPIDPKWRPFYDFCDKRIKRRLLRGWEEDMVINGAVNEWWFSCGECSVSNQSWQEEGPILPNGKRRTYWHGNFEYDMDEEKEMLDCYHNSLEEREKNAMDAIRTLIGLKLFRSTENQFLTQLHIMTFHKIAREIWATRRHRDWDRSFKVKPLRKK